MRPEAFIKADIARLEEELARVQDRKVVIESAGRAGSLTFDASCDQVVYKGRFDGLNGSKHSATRLFDKSELCRLRDWLNRQYPVQTPVIEID